MMLLYTEILKNPYLTSTLLGIVVLCLIYFYRIKNLPGPWGLPYFGLLPFLKNDFHLHFTELARNRYGDVFFVKITGQLYVHLASFDVINEAHTKKADCFPDRGNRYNIFTTIFDKGIIVDKGESWKVQRKFFVQAFREIASKQALSGPVADATQIIMKKLWESGKHPVNLTVILTEPCVKAGGYMNFGSGNDDLIPRLKDAYERMFGSITIPLFFITGEIARYFILPWHSGYRAISKPKKEMDSMLYEIIARRERAIHAGEAEDCFIDLYLQERKNRKTRGDPQAKFFNADALVPTLIELFGDGFVSIATFSASLLSDLSRRIEVQEKMRKEMLDVLGDDLRINPTLDHKAQLPYVNAVIKELHRCSSMFPIGPSLSCARETTVGGIRVPKGTMTMVNGWAANHDPRVYDNPDEFRPERFLSCTPGGVKINQQQQPYLFGVGKRACAGEFLTSMMVFCLVSAIIRNFVLKPTKEMKHDLTFVEFLNIEVYATPVRSS